MSCCLFPFLCFYLQLAALSSHSRSPSTSSRVSSSMKEETIFISYCCSHIKIDEHAHVLLSAAGCILSHSSVHNHPVTNFTVCDTFSFPLRLSFFIKVNWMSRSQRTVAFMQHWCMVIKRIRLHKTLSWVAWWWPTRWSSVCECMWLYHVNLARELPVFSLSSSHPPLEAPSALRRLPLLLFFLLLLLLLFFPEWSLLLSKPW